MTPGIERLYADYFDALVAHVRRRFGKGPPDPEDVAQRAFSTLLARGDLSDIDSPKAFLWRTADNMAVSDTRANQVRARHRREAEALSSSLGGYVPTPERVLEGKEQLALAMEVLHAMPEQRRRAFVLTRIEGLSHQETSRRLGISRPAVTKHVARATTELYAALMPGPPR